MNNRKAKRIKNSFSLVNAVARSTKETNTKLHEILKPVIQYFNVLRKRDNELVVSGLTRAEAQLAIDKAKASKKAALYMVAV